ncbi:MAG: DUF4424 family protein [Bacteroidetes bacterium]|nr:DUF4424 family protein [Bacteroidota bacterium]
MPKYLISVIFLVFCSINLISAQSLDFFREDLVFKLNRESLSVEGEYYFRNLTPAKVERSLFYPFPQDDDHGNVVWFAAWPTDEPDSSVVLRKRKEGGNFHAVFPPYSQRAYFIGYTQELKSGHARYILTTTLQWKKPFELANYKLWVPLGIQIDSLSYPPDKIDTVKEYVIYNWSKTNFMPDRDFEAWFR